MEYDRGRLTTQEPEQADAAAQVNLAIVSDIHYASSAEQLRRGELLTGIANPVMRWFIRLYRHHFWLRDPFCHNHLLDRFLHHPVAPDIAIANGDYSCDSAYVGVSDDASFASASECLGKLRHRFAGRFHASFGDHELGKKKMGSNRGGLRLASWHRARQELSLQPFWELALGNYVLMGVVSTLAALPVYEPEALPGEVADWRALRSQHLQDIEDAFERLRPAQRVLLFCHDPTALPFLYRLPAVQKKIQQIERTIIGHLHSNLILRQSRWLSGVPTLRWGHTIQRVTMALGEARFWKHFGILLCPSLAGIELLKDGGYYTARLDLEARLPAQFTFHPVPR